MATQTVSAEILFNNGEGADHRDLNWVQRTQRRITSELLQEWWGVSSSSVLRTVGPALAPVWAGGGSPMNVNLKAGVFAFYDSSDSDSPPDCAVSLVKTTQQAFTAPAADGSNPRWDIISVKVEKTTGSNDTRRFRDPGSGTITSSSTAKRRQSLVTMTYTTGTPAGSPSEPAVPAGHVKVARVIVGTGVTTLSQSVIYDFRVPAGGIKYFVPHGVGLSTAGEWVVSASGVWQLPGAANRFLRIPITPPRASSLDTSLEQRPTLRLAVLRLLYDLSSAVVTIVRQNAVSGAITDVEDVSSQLTMDGAQHYTEVVPSLPIWDDGARSSDGSGPNDYNVWLEIESGNTGDLLYTTTALWYGGVQ